MKPPGRPGKLNEEQVRLIRAVAAAREALPTNQQLAEEFGVSMSLISHVMYGHGYKRVRHGQP